MTNTSGETRARARVLSPVDRVSELLFGVFMAVSFTGAVSVGAPGGDEIRTMLAAALGCNLAWGLVDAVMYLVRTKVERARGVALLRRLRTIADPARARAEIAEAIPEGVARAFGPDGLEDMRRRLVAVPLPARAEALRARDYLGALAIFLVVVLSTFPLVLPFVLLSDARLALRVSHGVALVMLFAGGVVLGRHAGGSPWRTGLGMTVIGALLIAAIWRLGG